MDVKTTVALTLVGAGCLVAGLSLAAVLLWGALAGLASGLVVAGVLCGTTGLLVDTKEAEK